LKAQINERNKATDELEGENVTFRDYQGNKIAIRMGEPESDSDIVEVGDRMANGMANEKCIPKYEQQVESNSESSI